MTIEIDQKGLVHLVMGYYPHYDLIGSFEKEGYGRWVGGFRDEWIWNKSKLETLSAPKLHTIYLDCRASWKNTV